MAWEKKAEIGVDERFRAKNEAIKTYFDSNITKILMGSGNVDKCLSFGREIVALQLLVGKQRKQIELDQSEKESLEVNLRFYRDQVAELESKSRDLKNKLS